MKLEELEINHDSYEWYNECYLRKQEIDRFLNKGGFGKPMWHRQVRDALYEMFAMRIFYPAIRYKKVKKKYSIFHDKMEGICQPILFSRNDRIYNMMADGLTELLKKVSDAYQEEMDRIISE